MSEWQVAKMGEVAQFLNGRAFKASEFKEEGTPIVRIQNLTGIGTTVFSDLILEDTKYIDTGDLIYAWSATFGPFLWKSSRSIYHYHIWKVICDENRLDKMFFYYYLQHKSDELRDKGNGTLFIHITKELMESFPIHLPALLLQKKIAEVLSSLDDKIDLLQRQNKTLEQMAETLFRQWFVEEVREQVLLGRVLKTTSGGTPSRTEASYYQGDIPWIKSKELTGLFVLDTEEKITSEALRKSSAKMLPPNTVLVAMYGATVGEIGISSSEATCNQAICAIPETIDYPYTYLVNFFKSKKDELINLAVGAAQQNISQVLIQNMEIDKPCSEIKKYDKIVRPLYEKLLQNQRQIYTLGEVRDSLLPKLMNGTVRVSPDNSD